MSETTARNNTVGEGMELLLSLIYPAVPDRMSEKERGALARAAAIQDEFDRTHGDAAVKSRAVGDVRVTYADAEQTVQAGGHPIAPAALAVLKNEGLLCRWV